MFDTNPFSGSETDRHALWEMLVRRDIDAYVIGDWESHSRDFAADLFLAIGGNGSANPDSWSPAYPALADYAKVWLDSARHAGSGVYTDARREATYRATTLRDIDIAGDLALAHKKFDGALPRVDGGSDRLDWQTIYICKRIDGVWKIAGFIGFLPNPMGARGATSRPAIVAPTASQHVTAGPYSPVLDVEAARLVVISGQVGVAADGAKTADVFSEEVASTLANCAVQLAAAGCSFSDVFKVNCYLADLDDWPAFNAVYGATMPRPLPVRTTVGVALLEDFRIEIEMWAARK